MDDYFSKYVYNEFTYLGFVAKAFLSFFFLRRKVQILTFKNLQIKIGKGKQHMPRN